MLKKQKRLLQNQIKTKSKGNKMSDITIDEIKRLRGLTGVGLTDAKAALVEAKGDFDIALAAMRKKGLTKAEKSGEREARAGVIGNYNHDGRIGVLVEVNCETDFVARNEEFQKLVKELAMQVAGLDPKYPTIESIPADVLEAKKAELLAGEEVMKKPENIRPQIVEGQLKKWYQSVVLYEQPFRDSDQKVGDLVTEAIAKIGENIRVRRFVRYQLGEDI